MSRAQFTRRLCALEGQCQPDTADGWTPPVFADDGYEEVLRLLQGYGSLEAVLHSLASCPSEEP